MTWAVVRAARPKQWAKNVLVFAAPGAAGVLDDGGSLLRAVVALVAMCAASSGTYLWNDVLDVEADRRHERKRHRPVASGELPIATARAAGTVLLAAGVAGASALRWQAGAVVAVYVVLTLGYSAVLKHVAVVDLVAVAAGFVLRAVTGAVATDVPMSTWFLLTTSFGSLFIVAGKRYAELREHGAEAAQVRPSLQDYTLGFLRVVLTVAAVATLATYCVWAFSTEELAGTSLPFYELSVVPMAMALLRYTLILEEGHGAAPEDIFAADRLLQLVGSVWLVAFGLGIYLG